MATKIKPLRKFTTGTPSTSDMEAGEIAVNTADKKVFMRDDSNNIVEVGAASSLSLPITGGTLTGDLSVSSTADGGPNINLVSNDPSDVADFNTEGTINFKAENSVSQEHNYATIRMMTDDVTDGTEDGRIRFHVASGGLSGNLKEAFDITSTRIQIRNSLPLEFANAGGSGVHTSLQVATPSSTRTITFPDASGTVFTSGNPNAITDIGIQQFDVQLGVDADLIFEGATANANETTLTVVDPTSDRTITLPDDDGTVVLGTTDFPFGTTNESLPTPGAISLATPVENDDHVFHPYLNNDLAHFIERGGSYAWSGLTSAPSQASTAVLFRANSDIVSISNSNFTGTTASLTLTNLPKGLHYSAYVGIVFGHSSFSPDTLVIETSTNNGASFTTRLNDNSSKNHYVARFDTGATATNAIRFTFGKNTAGQGQGQTSIRLTNITAYNYNSSGMENYFLPLHGGTLYGDIFLDGNYSIIWDGFTNDSNTTSLVVTDPTAVRTITLPDATGTVALTSQIPTVPTNASIHLKPHFVKVSNEDSATAGTKYIKVATINSSTPSNSSSTFVFRILLEGRNELNGASQFRVHIRTGDTAAKSSVVVEQEHSNRHTYYGIDSFIFFWNSQNNSEFWVKLPNNGDTAYQQLFAKLEVSAPEDTEYVSSHDDVTIHTSQAWTTSTPSGTNQITAEWIKKRFDSIIFEGSTTDTSETFLQAADPTADRTITLPDASGTVHTTANPEINGAYGSTSAPRIFKVTVATQTAAHPYNGDGSTNKYSIDGVQGAALTLHGADDDTANSEYIYRFDQSDNTNNGHPLRFYLEANKTTAYTTGVTTNGTPGQAGAYTQIAVTRNTPKVLYYQCSQHGYMGNYVTIATAGIGAVVDDTSPQLGGNLDGNTYDIQLDNNSKYQWGQTAAATYITGNSSSTHTNSNIQFWLQSGNGFVSPTLYLESTGIMMPTNKDIRFEGTAADVYETTLTVTNPTADRTITFPDASGTVALTSQLGGGGSASDSFKTIAVSGQSDVVADSSTDTLTLVAGSNMSITTNASGDSITFASSGGGGTASDSFKTISVSGQSDVVADSSTDTLTLVAGNNMTITTNASGDEISFAASGGAGSGISEEQAIAFAIVYG